nr:MAG TPA: hypothetical protein [Bacteriophage sp.]
MNLYRVLKVFLYSMRINYLAHLKLTNFLIMLNSMQKVLQSLCLKNKRRESLNQKTNLNKLLCIDSLQRLIRLR